jgi:hypothetical protein
MRDGCEYICLFRPMNSTRRIEEEEGDEKSSMKAALVTRHGDGRCVCWSWWGRRDV